MSACRAQTGVDVTWAGGQVVANTAALPFTEALRRPGPVKGAERFELGDIIANVGPCRVVVEFESAEVPLSNLLKYWPYIRGELGARPSRPVVICHFSDWWSYATRRDLWEWTLARMKADRDRVVEVEGKQFDHWGNDQQRRSQSMHDAIDWISCTAGCQVRSRREYTPLWVLRTRLEARNARLPRFNFWIGPDTLEAFTALFEAPTEDEGAEVVVIRDSARSA
jgi:hypothetical protein